MEFVGVELICGRGAQLPEDNNLKKKEGRTIPPWRGGGEATWLVNFRKAIDSSSYSLNWTSLKVIVCFNKALRGSTCLPD